MRFLQFLTVGVFLFSLSLVQVHLIQAQQLQVVQPEASPQVAQPQVAQPQVATDNKSSENNKLQQMSEADKKAFDQDAKELEALAAAPETASAAGQKRDVAATQNPEFYKFFGKDMSIRGDGKFIYIKAGPTSIVADSKGRVQIKSAENVFMQSKKSIYLQADENINLIAGGEITQSTKDKGPKPSSDAVGIVVSPKEEKVKEEEVKPAESAVVAPSSVAPSSEAPKEESVVAPPAEDNIAPSVDEENSSEPEPSQ